MIVQPQWQNVAICSTNKPKAPCISFVNGYLVYYMPKDSKDVCPDWASVCFRGRKSEKGKSFPKAEAQP